MRTKQWSPGSVLRAKPRRDGVHFTNHRRRPHIVLSDYTAIPTTAGRCVHQHLLPSATNGLRKPSDLILDVRCEPNLKYAYLVIGHLSEEELQMVEWLARRVKPHIFIDLRG